MIGTVQMASLNGRPFFTGVIPTRLSNTIIDSVLSDGVCNKSYRQLKGIRYMKTYSNMTKGSTVRQLSKMNRISQFRFLGATR